MRCPGFQAGDLGKCARPRSMRGSGPYGNRAPEIASSAVLQKSRTQVNREPEGSMEAGARANRQRTL